MKSTESMSLNKLLATIVIGFSPTLNAMAVDCRTAADTIDRLICSDAKLLRLDAKLNDQYKVALSLSKGQKDLIQDQRNWIKNRRNACGSLICLQLAYAERIEKLVKLGEKCAIDEKTLVGYWDGSENAGFEEMALENNVGQRDFISWRHHRPEMTGKWILKDCTVHISNAGDGTMSYDLRIVKYEKGKLSLRDLDDLQLATYRKINQALSKN